MPGQKSVLYSEKERYLWFISNNLKKISNFSFQSNWWFLKGFQERPMTFSPVIFWKLMLDICYGYLLVRVIFLA